MDRWRRLEQSLVESGELAAEITHHLNLARQAHERHVSVLKNVEMLAGVHDQLEQAALIVDDEANLIRANSAASRLLAAASGLRVVHGRLETIGATEQARLLDAIAGACAGARDRDRFVAISRSGQRPLCLVVLTAEQRVVNIFEKGPLVLLLIIDPDASDAAGADVLRTLFDLTPREAEVAALLMEGHTIDETAQILGVAITTARTFLAHLTAKTDSHSQPELVRRLLAVPRIA